MANQQPVRMAPIKKYSSIDIYFSFQNQALDLTGYTITAHLNNYKTDEFIGAFTITKDAPISGAIYGFTASLPHSISDNLQIGIDYSFDILLDNGRRAHTDSMIIEIVRSDTPPS